MRSLILVLLLSACASVQPGPQATIDDFLAALDRGDASIAALFTEDATVFFPINNQPLRANGRAEIAAAFASLFGPNYRGGLPKPDDVRVQNFGETAVSRSRT